MDHPDEPPLAAVIPLEAGNRALVETNGVVGPAGGKVRRQAADERQVAGYHDVPLFGIDLESDILNGIVGVWLHRVTPPFRRRNEGLHSPE